jgi:predicted SPOUT superfamily RNA methylase MTH1
MLKKSQNIILISCFALFLYSCAGNSTAYQMDASEKEKQRGYHANEANRIIDTNKQNRKANAKTAEKNRQQTNREAEEKAKLKKKKAAGKSQDKFSFY